MTNKTPSQLNDFTGDKSMYLHAQKPGKSERVSIDYLTKDSLKSGDVVAKPVGNHDGFYECDGRALMSEEDSGLASALNIPEFGSYVSSLNTNSEIRTGDFVLNKLHAFNGTIYAVSDTDYFHYAGDNSGGSSEWATLPGENVKYFSSKNYLFRSYISSGSTVIEIFQNNLYWSTIEYFYEELVTVIGAVSFKEYPHLEKYQEFLFYVRNGELVCAEYDISTSGIMLISTENVSPLIATSGEIVYCNDYSFFFQAGNEIYGLNIFMGMKSIQLLETASSSDVSIFRPEYISKDPQDEFLYFSPDGSTLFRAIAFQVWGGLQQEQVNIPAGTQIKNVSGFGNNFIIITKKNGAGIIHSFDGGVTWNDAPAMSGYADSIYHDGAVYAVGGSGTTGSINSSSGTLQINSVNFSSKHFFYLPEIKEPGTGMAFYIKR